ncbi:MAG: hypothetical protein C5B52_06120 [Bacteroidetes bacterium]|nr:MAG: hypothetical protein C5B52_06120 [Bacteroidota bacterium]
MNNVMRRSISAILGLVVLACFGNSSIAQQKTTNSKTKTKTETTTSTSTPKSKSSKKQEIVIKKTGDDKKMTIVINGDNITVNGKPIDQYEGDDLVISKRDYEDWGGYGDIPQIRVTTTPRPPHVMVSPRVMTVPRYNFSWNDGDEKPRPLLGVYTENDEKGAKVSDIVDESPAEKAGLKKGDIITRVGDKKIEDPSSLAETIGDAKPNTEVELTYLRDGKEQKVKVKLAERKSEYKAYNYSFPNDEFNYSAPDGNQNFNFYYNRKPRLGARIQDTEDGKGVKVLEVQEGSAAEKAGLKKDDVITEIDGKSVKSADDAREVMSDLDDKYSYNIKANRNGSPVSIDVKIPKPLKTSNL